MTICLQKCRKIRGLGCVNQARIRARVTQPSPRIYLHICRSRWDLFLLFGVSRVSIIWEALIRCPSRNFLQWKFDFNASSWFSSAELFPRFWMAFFDRGPSEGGREWVAIAALCPIDHHFSRRPSSDKSTKHRFVITPSSPSNFGGGSAIDTFGQNSPLVSLSIFAIHLSRTVRSQLCTAWLKYGFSHCHCYYSCYFSCFTL